jgi:signal transduction histidine kinase
MIRRLMIVLLLLGGAGLLRAGPVACTVSEALEMPEAQLAREEPRVFRGLLTYYEPGHRMAFLQDETGSIYLQIVDSQDASAGDEVEVTGIVDPGIDGRNLRGLKAGRSPEIRVLQKGRWPQAVPATAAEVASGMSSSRWTRTEGRILSVETAGDRVRLTFEGYPELPVYIPGIARQVHAPGHLEGLRVGVSGVPGASPLSTRPPLMQRVLLVPSLDHVEVFPEDREQRFEVPEVMLHDLRWIPGEGSVRNFAKVRGVVTLVRPGRGFYLQRGTSSAWVQCTEPAAPELGDRVECSGIPGGYHGAGMLRDAMWRPFGELLAPIEAVRISVAEMFSDDVHGRLATFEGVVVENYKSPGEEVLVLAGGGSSFSARIPWDLLPAGSPSLERGSRVRVTGVCINRPSPAVDSFGAGGHVQMLSRHAVDIDLLSRPPFWDTRRLAWLLAGLLVLFSAAGAWVVALRRQVRQQELVIRRQAVHEDRVRIAREWHDTFEQHFVGLTMQLDAAASVIPSGTLPRQMLERAAEMADHSRSEARQAIWDLRAPEAGEGTSFFKELEKSLRGSWPEDGVPRLEILAEREAAKLPLAVTAHLLRIAHEAVANAHKHASASIIRVRWSENEAAFELAVEDDGTGIPPESIQKAGACGHFGLLGLRERAHKLKAKLHLVSPPPGKDRGTAVILELPRTSISDP